MIYGQFQYYCDELKSWSRILAFHKEELRESIRQIKVLGSQQIVSPSIKKVSSSFSDQLMVQEQQFEHITNQIISQQQRLEHTGSYSDKPVEYPICQQQDALRAKMQNTERHFVRTKYTCAIFLSSLLAGRSLALQN